ncbi:MAG TPA: exo-alpha-sialidase [Thermoplasmata archaeon]
MKASGSGGWLQVAIVIHLLVASLILSVPAQADSPLQASLDYSILAQPYDNSVRLNGTETVAADRDPSSPYFGTIYALGAGLSGWNETLIVQRSLDGGQTFSTPAAFTACTTGNSSCVFNAPAIAVGTNGVAYIAAGRTVWRSADQGLSWQSASVFTNSQLAEMDGNPYVSISTDIATGAVYVGTVNSSRTVLVASSVDGGRTWTSADVADGAAGFTPVARVAALRNHVAVAFLSSNASTGYTTVDVAASPDGGLTWPRITAVSPPVTNFSTPSLAVSADGTFAVSWPSPVGAPTEWSAATLVSISLDGGNAFSTPIEVSRYTGGADGGFGDGLVFDNGSRLYVTWISWRAANGTWFPTITVGSSTNLAQNFTNASFRTSVQGGGSNASAFVHLAAGPDGSVYLTWYDDYHRPFGYFFRSVSGEASGDVVPGTRLAPGTQVAVELLDPATAAVQARAVWTGSTLRFAELPPNVYDVWIRLGNASARAGSMPVRTWNTTAFTVHVETGPTGSGTPPVPWITAAAVGGVVLFAAAILVAFQHTRLVREQVLQRKVRLLMYEGIRDHPGSCFSEVRDALGLRNGSAAYHLGVLEKQGLIHAEKGHLHRWYFPNGNVSLWRDMPLSPLQKSIIEQVRQAPGIGIRELARNLNRHHASVAYNVRGLAREGFLRTQHAGRKLHCFLMDESGTS